MIVKKIVFFRSILVAWAILGAMNFILIVAGIDFCLFTITKASFLMDNCVGAVYALGVGSIFALPLAVIFFPNKN